MSINKISPTTLTTSVLIGDLNVSEPTLSTVGGVTVSAALEIQSTLGALLVPRMLQAERDNLTVTNGMILYNLDSNSFELYQNGAWGPTGGLISVNAISLSNGLNVTGGPITTSGTFDFSLDDSINNLTNVVTTGFFVKARISDYLCRTLITASSSRITITDPDGIVGNPVFDLATTAVTAASYIYPSAATVDAYGRLTSMTGGSAPVLISGSTMTGFLTLNGNPTLALQAVPKQYADAIAAGLSIQASCYAATTANLNATYANGASGVGATLTNAGALAAFSTDGVSPSVNSRILVKDQSSAFQNGIYTLTTVGSGAAAWVLTRASDYDQVSEIQPGDFVIINNGNSLSNTGWVETATVTTIGTDAISFSRFGQNIPYIEITAQNELFFGTNTGNSGALSSKNVAVGEGGVFHSINGSTDSIGFGYLAGRDLTVGVNGCYLGSESGKAIVSANSCIALGAFSQNANTIQDNNISIGDSCLKAFHDTVGISTNNTFIGHHSGLSITTGIANNTVIGAGTLGVAATNLSDNVIIGQNAAAILDSSISNVIIGKNCAQALTQGDANVFIGRDSCPFYQNFTQCLFIGGETDSLANNLTNAVAIGFHTRIGVSNAMNLGENCQVGINQNTPLYNLDIGAISNICAARMATGTTIPSFSATGTNIYTYTAQSTNATPLSITIFTVPSNTSAIVEVTINGATTTLSDFTGGNAVSGFKNAAGTVAMIGATYNKIVSTTGDFSIFVIGSDVILIVTGIAASTYNWTATVRYQVL